jgi:hypothetical protein
VTCWEQVAATYLVTDAVAGKVNDRNVTEGIEETPAGQIAALGSRGGG